MEFEKASGRRIAIIPDKILGMNIDIEYRPKTISESTMLQRYRYKFVERSLFSCLSPIIKINK